MSKSSSRRSRRRRSKSKVRIPVVNKGSLAKLGYSMSSSKEARRKVLARAVKKYGYSTVMKRVNLLYIYNKNNHPMLAMKAKQDKKWLMRTYKSVRKMSRRSRRSRRLISMGVVTKSKQIVKPLPPPQPLSKCGCGM